MQVKGLFCKRLLKMYIHRVIGLIFFKHVYMNLHVLLVYHNNIHYFLKFKNAAAAAACQHQ